ncbi:MAG: orotidine-5'-phosphate decarboxylase [Acidobacteria bacterium]|nr:orotidine-5'-phosphate decarboxylase [Acidobacteriota bacterium]
MSKPCEAPIGSAPASDQIILALDVNGANEARSIVKEIAGRIGAFKIGLQLFTAAGPSFVREMTSAGHKVFLDLKFHDIPNTVASAAVEAARMGVWMFNVHAMGGSNMMRRTVEEVNEACAREKLARPLIIAVTVLTSVGDDDLAEVGFETTAGDSAVRLATIAAASGLDGVVASPLEAAAIRSTVANKDFVIVTPGIRRASATKDDQRRVNTFRQALANGSTYTVIGRPILSAADRIAAINDICSE